MGRQIQDFEKVAPEKFRRVLWPKGPAIRKTIPKSMKICTILAVAAAAIALASSALGDKYSDLVARGFRWATADGLYACVSKDDVRRMVNNPTPPAGDEVELKMVEQVKAYYLIPGTIFEVTED